MFTRHKIQRELSIPLLGPILCTYIFLWTKQYQYLGVGLFLSIITTIMMTLSWCSFLKDYRFQKETLLSSIKHFFGMLLLFIAAFVIMMGIYIVINIFQVHHYIKNDIYILSQQRIYSFIYLVVGLEIMIIFLSYISKFFKHKDYQYYDFVLPFIKRHLIIWLISHVLIIYIAFVNVVSVTPQTIVKHSFFHPFGVTYQMDDIKQVKTGFHKKGFLFLQNSMEQQFLLKIVKRQTNMKVKLIVSWLN